MAENTPPPAHGLVKKLAEVMALVNRIPKNGYNERQGYKYATESDVMDCVRGGLAERGVMITHDVLEYRPEWRESKSGGAMQYVTVCLEFTARDAEGATLALGREYGQGQDSGEKAVYKAITGAVKYKLLKQFLMSSGDDPEAEKKPIHRERQGAPEHRGERPATSGAPTVFPNFGPAKGGAIRGASVEHLGVYLEAARKSLADPSKAKWHAKESALIGAIEAELARQRSGAVTKSIANGPADPPGPPPPRVIDQQAGESEDHAKQRTAGVFYAKAVKAGKDAGWEQADVGKWLRENRGRGGKGEVTAEDAELFCRHLEPPPEPGAGG